MRIEGIKGLFPSPPSHLLKKLSEETPCHDGITTLVSPKEVIKEKRYSCMEHLVVNLWAEDRP
jgi:hypothetical protein